MTRIRGPRSRAEPLVDDGRLDVICERVLTTGHGEHNRIIGFQLVFSAALNASRAGDFADDTLTQTVKRGQKTIRQPVGLQPEYSPSAYTVSLNLVGNPQFTKGGRIVVNATPPYRIIDSSGNPLTGNTFFFILPNAQGVFG